MTNRRKLHLIETDSLAEAKAVAINQCDCSDLTVIDTTTDFNQNKWLGQELSHTLIYIQPNTKINGILAVSGCVRGGCHLFFSFQRGGYPPFYRDFFIPKIRKIIDEQRFLNSDLSEVISIDIHQQKRQLESIAAIGKVTHLIGERGTGKSTLLGGLIEQLCREGNRTVLLSPSRKASGNTLKYLHDVSRETFRFFAGKSPEITDLQWATQIIVDEAASIDKAMLNAIITLKHQAVIIFATTVDGYEGTGQSYRLTYLDNSSDKVMRLTEPKRFSADDPLYLLSQSICRPALLADNTVGLADGEWVFTADVMQKKGLMMPVFALLQAAHYRTTPNDLASFYDNDAYFVVTVKHQQITGASHALPEALPQRGVNNALITDVINGRRRIKNAMTQQSIINAYADSRIADKNILRISRIAVDKNCRRQGRATAMLNSLEAFAKQNQVDFLSTSFSANADTLQFWLSQGFKIVRIGIYKNKWHNRFSLLLLKPLSTQNIPLVEQLQGYFQQHYQYYQAVYSQQKDIAEIIEQQFYPTLSKAVNTTPLYSQVVIDAIGSVVQHYRDIHWILPMLATWGKTQNLPHVVAEPLNKCLTGEFLDKKNKSNAINALLLLKDSLLENS